MFINIFCSDYINISLYLCLVFVADMFSLRSYYMRFFRKSGSLEHCGSWICFSCLNPPKCIIPFLLYIRCLKFLIDCVHQVSQFPSTNSTAKRGLMTIRKRLGSPTRCQSCPNRMFGFRLCSSWSNLHLRLSYLSKIGKICSSYVWVPSAQFK